MHVPDHFALPEERLLALLAAPRAGNLVTVHADGPLATFVPFHLERDEEGTATLVTHLVANNPQLATPATGPAMVLLDITDTSSRRAGTPPTTCSPTSRPGTT